MIQFSCKWRECINLSVAGPRGSLQSRRIFSHLAFANATACGAETHDSLQGFGTGPAVGVRRCGYTRNWPGDFELQDLPAALESLKWIYKLKNRMWVGCLGRCC